jgi:hypothetical protein
MGHLSDNAESFLRVVHSTKDSVSLCERLVKEGWGQNEHNCSIIGTHAFLTFWKKVRGQNERNCSIIGTQPFLANTENQHEIDARDKVTELHSPELERFIESNHTDDLKNRYSHFNEIDLFDYENDARCFRRLGLNNAYSQPFSI